MQYFSVDEQKRNRIMREHDKKEIHVAKPFVKFSYYTYKALRIMAIILGLVNLIYVVLFSHDPLDLLFLLMTIGFPLGISFIFLAVCRASINDDIIYKQNEQFGIDDTSLVYSYSDMRSLQNNYMFTFKANLSDIDYVSYDSYFEKITVWGTIKCQVYSGDGRFIEENDSKGLYFYNIFDIDIIDIFKKTNVSVKEK